MSEGGDFETARASRAEKRRRARRRVQLARGVTIVLAAVAGVAALRLFWVDTELAPIGSERGAAVADRESPAREGSSRDSTPSPASPIPPAARSFTSRPSGDSSGEPSQNDSAEAGPPSAKPADPILPLHDPLRSFLPLPEKFEMEGGGALSAGAEVAGSPPTPEQRRAAMERRAARLYQQQCAVCHGSTGKGDGPYAPRFGPLEDLSAPGYWAITDEARVRRLIRFGSGPARVGPRMPGFEPLFADETELDALIDHLRELGREEN